VKTKKRIEDAWIIEGDVAYLDAKHGRILIDVDDLERVRDYHVSSWSSGRHKVCGIAYATYDKNSLLHRLILRAPKGVGVDHINGNGLDDRKSNLRLCTQSENLANQKPGGRKRPESSSAYRGVYRHGSKWLAKVKYEGEEWVAVFRTEEEARTAREVKAREIFGEFYRSDCPTASLEMPKAVTRTSTTGERCVYFRSGRFVVLKCHESLGTFPTLEEAVAARDAYESSLK
jgi:hypothetical protein